MNFEMIETNGIKLNTFIDGEGPLVILLHGMPSCWYLWKDQITSIVDLGYKVAVPDQRGYGQSECPPNVNDYNILELTKDIKGIADYLNYDKFIVIGHDWGGIVAYHMALIYEKECQAVMGISSPFWRVPNSKKNPNKNYLIDPPGMDNQFWYMRYFQEEGIAEKELEVNVRNTLLMTYYNLSNDSPIGSFVNQLSFPKDSKFLETMSRPTEILPWLSCDYLDYCAEQFIKSGFRGPINWYRNIINNNIITSHLDNKLIKQPSAFLIGKNDDLLLYTPNWKESFPKAFEDLRFIDVIEDGGHYLPIEKPEETTESIIKFLKGIC